MSIQSEIAKRRAAKLKMASTLGAIFASTSYISIETSAQKWQLTLLPDRCPVP